MGQIAMEGMRFFGHISCDDTERQLGQWYELDVLSLHDFTAAANSDELGDTLNYETMFLIARLEMQRPAKLMEHMAYRILHSIEETTQVLPGQTSVCISRKSPALDFPVRRAFTIVKSNFEVIVGLEGIKLYGYHGFYEEEQILGNFYEIDITASYHGQAACTADDISACLNYESLYTVVKYAFREPSKLLENIYLRISEQCRGQFKQLASLEIKISKLGPPVSGQVARSFISERETYSKVCARCKKAMLCHNIATCWCADYKIAPATLEALKGAYRGCLCAECMAFYARQTPVKVD